MSYPSHPLNQVRRPLFLAAVAALALNDLWLKPARILPSLLTGKLSDLAGLLVAPLLLAALLGVRRRSSVLGCHLAVGGVFAALKLSPACAAIHDAALAAVGLHAHTTVDPSDLLALAMLPASLRWFFPRRSTAASSRGVHRAQSLAVVAFALLVCAGSSASLFPRIAVPRAKLLASGGLVLENHAGEIYGDVLHAPLPLDCDALLEDPSKTLPTLKFTDAPGHHGVNVPPEAFERVPSLPDDVRCDAALVSFGQSTWLGIGSDQLPPTYVVWDRRALAELRAKSPGKAGSPGAPGWVELRERDGGLRLNASEPVRLYLAPANVLGTRY